MFQNEPYADFSVPVSRQAMAGLYRTLLHDRRVLVVLDDARDADQLTDLLPSSRDCLAVVTSPDQYPQVVAALAAGGFTEPQRRRLAAAAFAHTARYDAAVASWFAASYAPDDTATETGWPELLVTLSVIENM